ncbi:MAG: methylated-DNA--[protein]-cysteine S-methyltransferase [Pseudomonadota bacterium]
MSSSRLLISSPIGELTLVATRAGLTHLRLSCEPAEDPPGDGSAEAEALLAEAALQLAAWFAGRRRDLDLPLAPSGTPFQREVWAALRAIPWGETISYGELARRVGRPGASRAIGGANHHNPLPIIIPCHRVVGHDGRLTGFGGGLAVKRWLLEHEGPRIVEDRLVRG